LSRNKRLAALLTALLLARPTALASSELIAPEQIVADEVKYKTCTVEYGEFAKQIMMSCSQYFPLVSTVRYRGDTAVYVETLVRRGQEVKAGDALLRVRVLYDEVQMAELELAYERAAEACEEGVQSRREAIDEMERALAAERDEDARQTMRLQLKKLKLGLEQFIYQQEYALADRQRQIDELNERHAVSLVTAPIDGVVSELTYLRDGDKLYDGSVVCQISSQEVMLLLAKDNRLRYGMEVGLETGVNKNRVQLTGHVVAATDCLKGVISEYALVEVDPWDEGLDFNWRNIRLTADLVKVGRVLMVDRKATALNSGRYSVTKLREDGVTQKRFVNQAMTNTVDIWLLQGLEEGDVVIID